MQGEQQEGRTKTRAGAPNKSKHRPDSRQGGLRAAGVAAGRIAGPIVAGHGGGALGRLKAAWGEVAGAEFAANSWPEALGRDGALKLRVAPGFGLELQHRAPLLIERVNGFFGRSLAVRLVLVQGPLPIAGRPARGATPPPSPAEAAALDAQLTQIADPELRTALAGLGRLVAGKNRRG